LSVVSPEAPEAPVLLVGSARNLRKQFKRVPVIHTERGRFHPASIAGLVVGAMGVFMFSVALRHWLRERREVMTQEAS
jgi:hypothetical protein